MNAKNAAIVGITFAESLAQQFPMFKETQNPGPPNWRLFTWKLSDSLYFFIFLIFLKGKNKFNIEIAYSRESDFPINTLTFLPSDEPVDGSLRFRISSLWEESVGEDKWWSLENEPSIQELRKALKDQIRIPREPSSVVKSRVSSTVDDAVNRVRDFAIPYFEQIAAKFHSEQYRERKAPS